MCKRNSPDKKRDGKKKSLGCVTEIPHRKVNPACDV